MPLRIDDPRLRNAFPRVLPPPVAATFEKISGAAGPRDFTTPGPRPWTFQAAINFQLNLVANTPQALASGQFAADTIVVDVLSSLSNSVFFGYGSQVSPSSGIEVRPGLPLTLSADTNREQWELQRLLEIMASALAGDHAGPYRAPRNVFDASQYFAVATVDTTIAVMLFPPNDN